jgi:hypothetical protein
MKLAPMVLATIAAALTIARPPLSAQGTVVHADGAPAWGTNVRLVPVDTVGSLDGPPEYAFGSVDLVVGEKRGGFFVFDSKYVQIRRYNASGKFVANIGRKGAGPGEYQELLGLAILGDSALVTWDPRNSRVTFFGLDGKVRSSFRPMLGGMTYAADVFGVDNTGIVYLQSGIGETRRYLRYRSNGTLLDTLTAVIDNPGGFVLQTTDGTRGNFAKDRLAKPSPLGGLITASTDTLGFAMTVGTKFLRVQRNYSPIPLGPEERAEWEAYADYFYARAQGERPQPGIHRPFPVLARIPSTKPAFRDLSAATSYCSNPPSEDRTGIWTGLYETGFEAYGFLPDPDSTGRPVLWGPWPAARVMFLPSARAREFAWPDARTPRSYSCYAVRWRGTLHGTHVPDGVIWIGGGADDLRVDSILSITSAAPRRCPSG